MIKFIFLISFLLNLSFVIKAQTTVDNLNVSPNPFPNRTLVYFSNSQTDTVSIVIYNALGSPALILFTDSVMTSGIHADSLKMETYPDGLYVVHLKLGHRKNIIKKLIKQSSIGLNELLEENTLILYPNPINSILNIKDEQNHLQYATIEIKNYLGQNILSIPFSNQIDVSFLASGMYLINIKNANGKLYYFKFAKE